MKSNNPLLMLFANREFLDLVLHCGKQQQLWVEGNMKLGRCFVIQEHIGIVYSEFTSPLDPYTEIMARMVCPLLKGNSRFYFDIEKHSSGIEIIKLQEGLIYDCTVLEKISGKPAPQGGHYPAETSSALISMLAYKTCLEFAKEDKDEGRKNEFKKRYEALLDSQIHTPFLKGSVFKFV